MSRNGFEYALNLPSGNIWHGVHRVEGENTLKYFSKDGELGVLLKFSCLQWFCSTCKFVMDSFETVTWKSKTKTVF